MIKANITLEVEGDVICPRAEGAAALAGRGGTCSPAGTPLAPQLSSEKD